MKKIPVRVIVIAVVLILLALCFFRKEGYDLTPEQSERLTKMFDEYEIPMNDRGTLWEYIRSTVKQKENMTHMVAKYLKTDFMRKLRAFSRTP
jgi:uncharacterized protein YwgA